jgi:RNA polymerase sigma factor (sigma-70 family)
MSGPLALLDAGNDDPPQALPPFDDVYTSHASNVYRFCLSQLGDAETAADVTQDAFIKAFSAYERVAPDPDTTRTWLISIARNCCIDYRRQNGRWLRLRLHETQGALRDLLEHGSCSFAPPCVRLPSTSPLSGSWRLPMGVDSPHPAPYRGATIPLRQPLGAYVAPMHIYKDAGGQTHSGRTPVRVGVAHPAEGPSLANQTDFCRPPGSTWSYVVDLTLFERRAVDRSWIINQTFLRRQRLKLFAAVGPCYGRPHTIGGGAIRRRGLVVAIMVPAGDILYIWYIGFVQGGTSALEVPFVASHPLLSSCLHCSIRAIYRLVAGDGARSPAIAPTAVEAKATADSGTCLLARVSPMIAANPPTPISARAMTTTI